MDTLQQSVNWDRITRGMIRAALVASGLPEGKIVRQSFNVGRPTTINEVPPPFFSIGFPRAPLLIRGGHMRFTNKELPVSVRFTVTADAGQTCSLRLNGVRHAVQASVTPEATATELGQSITESLERVQVAVAGADVTITENPLYPGWIWDADVLARCTATVLASAPYREIHQSVHMLTRITAYGFEDGQAQLHALLTELDRPELKGLLDRYHLRRVRRSEDVFHTPRPTGPNLEARAQVDAWYSTWSRRAWPVGGVTEGYLLGGAEGANLGIISSGDSEPPSP